MIFTVVPSDSNCLKAWQQIAEIARAHCLVVQAAGGVMTLALPEEQRSAEIRDLCLRMHMMVEEEEEKTTPAVSPSPKPGWWCCSADYPYHAPSCVNAIEPEPKPNPFD